MGESPMEKLRRSWVGRQKSAAEFWKLYSRVRPSGWTRRIPTMQVYTPDRSDWWRWPLSMLQEVTQIDSIPQWLLGDCRVGFTVEKPQFKTGENTHGLLGLDGNNCVREEV